MLVDGKVLVHRNARCSNSGLPASAFRSRRRGQATPTPKAALRS